MSLPDKPAIPLPGSAQLSHSHPPLRIPFASSPAPISRISRFLMTMFFNLGLSLVHYWVSQTTVSHDQNVFIMGYGALVVFTVPYWPSYPFYLAPADLLVAFPVILTDSTGGRGGLEFYFGLVLVHVYPLTWVVGIGTWSVEVHTCYTVGLVVLDPSP